MAAISRLGAVAGLALVDSRNERITGAQPVCQRVFKLVAARTGQQRWWCSSKTWMMEALLRKEQSQNKTYSQHSSRSNNNDSGLPSCWLQGAGKDLLSGGAATPLWSKPQGSIVNGE